MSVDFLQEMINKINIEAKPYPGLRPFETEDSPYFFGREKQTNELVSLLRKTKFLSVIGSSGSGKSSLIKAGLLPRLYKGLMSGDKAEWNICLLRPGHSPMKALNQSLFELKYKTDPKYSQYEELIEKLETPSSANGSSSKSQAQKKELEKITNALNNKKEFDKEWLEETLNFSSKGLINASNYIQTKGRLLIIVDQFEEIFRYKEENKFHSVEAKAFVDRLIHASKEDNSNIFVCITMRSDFMGSCSEFYNLPETIGEGFYLVPRMSRDELKMAIVRPAELVGALVDPVLVEKLANEVEDRQDQLPLLQHALMRTHQIWKSKKQPELMISMEDYQKSGGMRNALSNHANDILKKVKKRDENYVDIAKRIFQCITKGDGNRGVRRPVTLEVLYKTIKHDNLKLADVKEVIGFFRDKDNSLLMPPAGEELSKNTIIDISHESLMRNWDTLKKWIDEEVENARTYKKLLDALHDKSLSNRRTGFIRRWKLSFQPTKEWASRYGGKFDESTAFLHKNFVRKRLAKIIISAILTISLTSGVYLFYLSNSHLQTLLSYQNEVNTNKYLEDGNYRNAFKRADSTLKKITTLDQSFGNKFYRFKTWVYENVFSEAVQLSTKSIKQNLSSFQVQSFNSSLFQSFEIPDVKFYKLVPNKEEVIIVFNDNRVEHWDLKNQEIIGSAINTIGTEEFNIKDIVFSNITSRAMALHFYNDDAHPLSKVKVYRLDSLHKEICGINIRNEIEELRFESKNDYLIVKDTATYLWYPEDENLSKYDTLIANRKYNNHLFPRNNESGDYINIKSIKFSNKGSNMILEIDSITAGNVRKKGYILGKLNGGNDEDNYYADYQPFGMGGDWVYLNPPIGGQPKILNIESGKTTSIQRSITALDYEIPKYKIDDKYFVFTKKNSTQTVIYELVSNDPKIVTNSDMKKSIIQIEKPKNISGVILIDKKGAGIPLKGNYRILEKTESENFIVALSEKNKLLIWDLQQEGISIYSNKNKTIDNFFMQEDTVVGFAENTISIWSDNNSNVNYKEITLSNNLSKVAFSKSGTIFYGWNKKNTLQFGNIKDSTKMAQYPNNNVTHVAIANNDSSVIFVNDIIASDTTEIKVAKLSKDIDLIFEKDIKPLRLTESIDGIYFLDNAIDFITVSGKHVKHWKISSNEITLENIHDFEDEISDISYTENNGTSLDIVVGTINGKLYSVNSKNIKNKEAIEQITISDDPIKDVEMSDNLICATDGRNLFVLKLDENREFDLKYRLKGDSDFKKVLLSKGEDKHLYTLSMNGIIKKWCIDIDEIKEKVYKDNEETIHN